jgi:hypothetical protein
MATLDESQAVLRALGLPPEQQNVMSGYTLLALASLRLADDWSASNQPLLRVRAMIRFSYQVRRCPVKFSFSL